MGKSEIEKEKLNQTLTEIMSNIHETLQIMDLTPSSSLQKVSWEEVLKIGDQLSKNATSAGMLFSQDIIHQFAANQKLQKGPVSVSAKALATFE